MVNMNHIVTTTITIRNMIGIISFKNILEASVKILAFMLIMMIQMQYNNFRVTVVLKYGIHIVMIDQRIGFQDKPILITIQEDLFVQV